MPTFVGEVLSSPYCLNRGLSRIKGLHGLKTSAVMLIAGVSAFGEFCPGTDYPITNRSKCATFS